MKLSRRDFLKILGGTFAVAAISPKALIATSSNYGRSPLGGRPLVSEGLVTDAMNGGFLVPIEYRARLIAMAEDQAMMRSRPTTLKGLGI